MKMVMMRSLLIAFVLGILVTAISSILMATYHESSVVSGVSRTLTGFEAVVRIIQLHGVFDYLRMWFALFVLFFVGIFLGTSWQGFWMLNIIRRQ